MTSGGISNETLMETNTPGLYYRRPSDDCYSFVRTCNQRVSLIYYREVQVEQLAFQVGR